MTRAVLYARVSSDTQQKEATIESQLFELRHQIAAAGHDLVKEYIDDGVSGTVMDRPALEQLRQDAKNDLFDRIYFHAADRIARQSAHQTIIIDELLKRGKQITVGGKDYEKNPENTMTLNMLGVFAEYERAKIAERMTRGRLHRLERHTRRKAELAAQLRSPQHEDFVDASIRQFCANANARFQACADFDGKRQFLIDHVERVIYNRYKVTVVGFIPVQTASGHTKLQFRIKGEIDQSAVRRRLFGTGAALPLGPVSGEPVSVAVFNAVPLETAL